jgi:hypothetical protein
MSSAGTAVQLVAVAVPFFLITILPPFTERTFLVCPQCADAFDPARAVHRAGADERTATEPDLVPARPPAHGLGGAAAAQDTSLMRALGLAHHWQRLLIERRAESVAEIAQAEGIDVTQVRRLMHRTVLAPNVLEMLLSSPDLVPEKVMLRPWPSSLAAQKLGLPDRFSQ